MSKKKIWKTTTYPKLTPPASDSQSVFNWAAVYGRFRDAGAEVDPALMADEIDCGPVVRDKILSLTSSSRRKMDSDYLRTRYCYSGDLNQFGLDERGQGHLFLTSGLPTLVKDSGAVSLFNLLKKAPKEIGLIDEAWFNYFWIPIVEFLFTAESGRVKYAEHLLNSLADDLFWGDPSESLVEGMYADLAVFFTSAWLRQTGFDLPGSAILRKLDESEDSTSAFRDGIIPQCLDLFKNHGLSVRFANDFLHIFLPGQNSPIEYKKTTSKTNTLLCELFKRNREDADEWHNLDGILNFKKFDDKNFKRVFKDDQKLKTIARDVSAQPTAPDALYIVEYRDHGKGKSKSSEVRFNPDLRYVVEE